jgi:hypothetical protein
MSDAHCRQAMAAVCALRGCNALTLRLAAINAGNRGAALPAINYSSDSRVNFGSVHRPAWRCMVIFLCAGA